MTKPSDGSLSGGSLFERKCSMDRTPITKEGLERLREELKRLEREERPTVIKAIAEARSHGDLSENAEYHAAKERQAFIEGRIAELHSKIAVSEIIDISDLPEDRVVFGTTVLLNDLDTGDEFKIRLVGPDESNADDGDISVLSPLGRALIGKEPGDEIQVKTPGGLRLLEIMDINIS
jgi:transcription elongation factor GreA